MNLMMQLRKVCNHPYLFFNYEEFPNYIENVFRVSGKFELLDRIIPKFIVTGHRMLIFSQMTQVMNILEMFFDYRGFRYLRLDGNTKDHERSDRMRIFN